MLSISFKMKNSQNHNMTLLNDIEDPIRESPKQRSSDCIVDRSRGQRKAFDERKAGIHRAQEINAEAGVLFFVPKIGIREICFGLRPNDHLHDQARLRIFFLTSAQGEPADGSFLKAARRRSSSSRWPGVSLMAFGKAATLSQRSSTRSIRSEMFSFNTSAKDTFLLMDQKYHFASCMTR